MSDKLIQERYDLVFAPGAATEIAFLDTDVPIIYLSDATFPLLHNYYPKFSNLLKTSIRDAYRIEELALKKAALILYPTEWAANSAVSDYHVDKAKIHVIPFGANFDKIPNREVVLKREKSDLCRLLFLGVDWERKGGDIAFETHLELEKLGIRSELIICGCIPPQEFLYERMTVIPFLDKNHPGQRQRLAELFLASDFLMLPTRNDCYGIVFCEASAFGLPIITTRTGGVPGVVTDGQNGYMLPLNARGVEYAKVISSIFHDDRHYSRLVRASRRIYEEKLNWDSWGAAVRNLLLSDPTRQSTIGGQ
ncbi:MAG: glycosyltransferase family 4 protein [Nitrospirae bacterium]|nr:glycosyltransferase family 4 protein [Nitrospirota bacterium]